MTISYGDICHQVANTLKGAQGVKRVEAFDQIQESISVLPTLHVYMDAGDIDSETDRSTYGAGVRVWRVTIKIDGYARVRSHISTDLKEQMALTDAIDTILSTQDGETMYGTPYIRAHHWSWERGSLMYGTKDYAAVTFTLKLTIF